MDAPVQKGQVLGGKYRVERVLGAGGMGVVVAATHLKLDQPVAIKFLLPAAAQSRDAVARFAREARAAARIQGEHVARVLDVAELEDGAPYMVMEYLDGEDLAAVLEQGGPLPAAEAIDAVLQACEAVAEAHALGIVHRDLKPSNLFRAKRPDGSPIVKVLDFGISKAASATDMSLTKSAATMGSPLYMSPEQLRSSRDVDARTDVWSLGVILYELVSGERPFRGESLTALTANILEEQPASIRALGAKVPDELEAAVRRCLEKDRRNRFADVGELARCLAPLATEAGALSAQRAEKILRAAPPVAPAAKAARTATEPLTSTESPWTPESALPPPPRSRVARVAALGIVLVAAGAIGWILASPRAPATDVASPASSSPPALASPVDTTSATALSTTPPDSAASGSASAPARAARSAPFLKRPPPEPSSRPIGAASAPSNPLEIQIK